MRLGCACMPWRSVEWHAETCDTSATPLTHVHASAPCRNSTASSLTHLTRDLQFPPLLMSVFSLWSLILYVLIPFAVILLILLLLCPPSLKQHALKLVEQILFTTVGGRIPWPAIKFVIGFFVVTTAGNTTCMHTRISRMQATHMEQAHACPATMTTHHTPHACILIHVRPVPMSTCMHLCLFIMPTSPAPCPCRCPA